ncbi:hypothetical protein HG530_012876 [Fusarium avenaceum]|nr:hypothetical protein HG530_012876 [Fusarium avenaceum]
MSWAILRGDEGSPSSRPSSRSSGGDAARGDSLGGSKGENGVGGGIKGPVVDKALGRGGWLDILRPKKKPSPALSVWLPGVRLTESNGESGLLWDLGVLVATSSAHCLRSASADASLAAARFHLRDAYSDWPREMSTIAPLISDQDMRLTESRAFFRISDSRRCASSLSFSRLAALVKSEVSIPCQFSLAEAYCDWRVSMCRINLMSPPDPAEASSAATRIASSFPSAALSSSFNSSSTFRPRSTARSSFSCHSTSVNRNLSIRASFSDRNVAMVLSSSFCRFFSVSNALFRASRLGLGSSLFLVLLELVGLPLVFGDLRAEFTYSCSELLFRSGKLLSLLH